jgi:DNA-binding NarL/FixJ family response regulator
MVTQQIKELEVTKAKMAALEKVIAKRLKRELATLHIKYGFASIEEFVSALRGASGGGSRKGRRGRPVKATDKVKRRKRAVITEETRTNVKKLVETGKTGSQIAKSLGISLPSVQNIKKALGLVKARA